MLPFTNPITIAAISSHIPQPALQAIPEAATSRISLLPRAITNSQIKAVPGVPRPRISVFQPPTDEEIEAALAEARESDPAGQNDAFYYLGYQSREDVAEIPAAPIMSQSEGYDNEPCLYYHSVDDTWRVYPPPFNFPEVSDDEEEGAGDLSERKRKRDMLKRLGAQLFKRVFTLRKKISEFGGQRRPRPYE